MPQAVYMDVHVPAAVTWGLRRRGIPVITSQEDGTRQASDSELLARATETSCVLLSQDVDLLEIARDWQKSKRTFFGLIFASQEGISIGRLIEDVELLMRCCPDEEFLNATIFVPLR